MTSPVDQVTDGPAAAVAALRSAGLVVDGATGPRLHLRTSATTSGGRTVVRSLASWTDSFEPFTAVTGLSRLDTVLVPAPPATSSLFAFAVAHAAHLGASVHVLERWSAAEAARATAVCTAAHLTPPMLACRARPAAPRPPVADRRRRRRGHPVGPAGTGCRPRHPGRRLLRRRRALVRRHPPGRRCAAPLSGGRRGRCATARSGCAPRMPRSAPCPTTAPGDGRASGPRSGTAPRWTRAGCTSSAGARPRCRSAARRSDRTRSRPRAHPPPRRGRRRHGRAAPRPRGVARRRRGDRRRDDPAPSCTTRQPACCAASTYPVAGTSSTPCR